MINRFKPITPTVAILLMATVGIWRTFHFPKSQSRRYMFGPGFWPRLIGIFLVLATLLHIFLQVRKVGEDYSFSKNTIRDRNKKSLDEDVSTSSEKANSMASQVWRVLPGIAIAVTYVYLIPRLGFFVITPLFLIGFMLLLGARDYVKILFATCLLQGFMLLIFVRFLYLPVPEGTISVFRHANTILINLVS